MRRSFSISCALAIAALLPAAHAENKPAQASDKDVIEYREHIMHALDEQAAILGLVVSGLIPADNVTAHLDTIAMLASVALKSFEPNVAGGEARPEVWKNWPDFSQRMNEFAQKTANAAKLAHTEGPETAMFTMLDAMGCKGCHEQYRDEKK